jgi:hypothetical protein
VYAQEPKGVGLITKSLLDSPADNGEATMVSRDGITVPKQHKELAEGDGSRVESVLFDKQF